MVQVEDWRKDVAYSTMAHILMDYGGIGERTDVEVQRRRRCRHRAHSRGVGYKARTRSLPLYATDDWQSFHEERVFGTLEWRFTPGDCRRRFVCGQRPGRALQKRLA